MPYLPVVYINCAPDFSASTANEAFNLIGAGFEVWYNGNNTATLYKLPLQGLDEEAITISVGTADLTEGTHFMANRAAGTVDFAQGTAPHGAPATGTDNVRITAFKTADEAKQKITGCRTAIAFGGESSDIAGGTRAFLMRNPAYPCTYWYSDLGGGTEQRLFLLSRHAIRGPDTKQRSHHGGGQAGGGTYPIQGTLYIRCFV